jgi:hypothetical protein
MILYVSSNRRAILGRWSEEFAGALLVVLGLWLITLKYSRTCWRSEREPSPAAVVVDWAIFLWGLCYLIEAIDDRSNAGRLLDVNPFGSVTPVAVVLEWIALVLGFVATTLWLARRIPQRWQNPALALGAVLGGLLLVEGGIRIKAALAPAVASFPTTSVRIWVRRHVQLNREGFRDVEHPLKAKPEVHRLLMVGDSYTFGWGLPRVEQRLGEQLAARLGSGTGQPWEAVNAGRPDRHTLQEIEQLRQMLAYRPNVVILQYGFNDIDYLNDRLGFRPFVSRNVISEAPQSLADRIHPLRVLYWNSHLFQQVYGRIGLVHRGGQGGPSPFDAFADSTALAVHLGDLHRFVALARNAGAVVAIVPFEPRLTLTESSRERYRRFVNRAVSAGLPVWSLEDAFQPYSLEELTVSAIDRHPSELANRLAAEALYPRLLQLVRKMD